MNSPLVTVIVPVYGVEDCLPDCVESILRQSYEHLQVLLIDDGSPDGCGEICDRYAGRDCRVRAVHRANGGVGAARNTGLELAEGKYVCFVDGDDVIVPELAARAVEEMESAPWDLCMWGIQIWEEDRLYDAGRLRSLRFRFPEEEERARFLCRWFLPSRLGWSACQGMFRRALLESFRLRFGKAVFAEDMDFVFRCLLHSKSLRVLAEPLYRYRTRPASATHTIDPEEQLAQLLEILGRQRAELSELVPLQKFYLYEITLLARYVEEMGPGSPGERAGRMLKRLKTCQEWEVLREDAARLAADYGAVRRCCSLFYGNLVWAFCRFLLNQDEKRFERNAGMYRTFARAREARDGLAAWRKRERT